MIQLYNRVILVGRLTADPELKQTPNGVSVTSFSLAVNRAYSKDGEKQADFLDVVAWRSTAEFICRYFAKGRAILVEGSIQTRSYVDKQGQNRRVWEIMADKVSFVESKNAGGGAAPRSTDVAPPSPSGDSGDFAEIEDDGDLPF
jgi:single-strand DNA-binding protein